MASVYIEARPRAARREPTHALQHMRKEHDRLATVSASVGFATSRVGSGMNSIASRSRTSRRARDDTNESYAIAPRCGYPVRIF